MEDQANHGGRPRSEVARTAVLHAVDDLLVEVGYSSMTMKGIAERAGVGRQTVYRWWSTKAEILFEACVIDAEEELTMSPTGDPLDDLTNYIEALMRFLAHSPAGAAYRALLGEAQHDHAVAHLIAGRNLLADSAHAVIEHAMTPDMRTDVSGLPDEMNKAAALLVGPPFFWIVSGGEPNRLVAGELAQAFVRATTAAAP